MKRVLISVVIVLCVTTQLLTPSTIFACGHDGFYLGGGYTQLFMFTPKNRLGASNTRVEFGPGFGAHLVLGYDFCGTRWGIQIPFEFTRQKLNSWEWVNQFGSTAEGVFHIASWKNGIDIHVVGGIGWAYLMEGPIQNSTAAAALTVDVGPGVSYYFVKSDKVTASVTGEIPLRFLYYFGNHLSSGGTPTFAVPIRISMQVGF